MIKENELLNSTKTLGSNTLKYPKRPLISIENLNLPQQWFSMHSLEALYDFVEQG